jgi:hypothetical protein
MVKVRVHLGIDGGVDGRATGDIDCRQVDRPVDDVVDALVDRVTEQEIELLSHEGVGLTRDACVLAVNFQRVRDTGGRQREVMRNDLAPENGQCCRA